MTFTPAEIAAWQREVDYWAARFEAAWDVLAWREIEAARVALRALLDLRDLVREQASSSEKFT